MLPQTGATCIPKEQQKTKLYAVEKQDDQLPIVYSSDYDISFCGLESLHPFDAGKWGKIATFLQEAGISNISDFICPFEASEEDLLVGHTADYLKSLKSSYNVARITEVPPVAILPNWIVQRKLLRKLRLQTGGTILGAKLAIECGWCINVGGGFHHCSSESGGGFCAYADITLAIKHMLLNFEQIKKVMIIDLDAHQGNGHERDFQFEDRVYILDAFNDSIYPYDYPAMAFIDKAVRLQSYTEDEKYLNLINKNIDEALKTFPPDFILYNAGTDIIKGDPLGDLSITAEGVIQRDEVVFKKARERNIPILMVTSGGYQKSNARVIADSILNLKSKGLLSLSQ
eukprot:gene6956-7738_t